MTQTSSTPPRIGPADPDSWSTRLWTQIGAIFDAIVAHPFVAGLTEGSLDSEASSG